MDNIISHQGNANQTHNEVPLTFYQNNKKIKKNDNIKYYKGCAGNLNPHILLVGI